MLDVLVTSAATETNGTATASATATAGTSNDGDRRGTLRGAIDDANGPADAGQTIDVTFASGIASVVLGRGLPALTGDAVAKGGGTAFLGGGDQVRPPVVGDRRRAATARSTDVARAAAGRVGAALGRPVPREGA